MTMSWDYYRWKIQREVEKIARELRTLFEELDRELVRPTIKEREEFKGGFVHPEVEIHENDDVLVVEVELPGVKKDNLDLFVSE
ncbi:MAG TPA: hypothetical protein EYP68_08355, partial [Candidatus Korarchaeota archaeon]|nr:hypothetical protein [Candidatus Korarchaeota archaeon]